MKLMDLLQEKLEKKIGDEWVGKDGREYKMDKDGILVNQDDIWKRISSISRIDDILEDIKEEWRPITNEFYYHIGIGSRSIHESGFIMVKGSNNDSTIGDEGRMRQGNYFKTREEAEEKLEKILGVLNGTY